MGNVLGGAGKEEVAEECILLVPPLFERVEKDESRFCLSSYPHLFGDSSRSWLFEDYVQSKDIQARLRLQAPGDRRVQVSVDLAPDPKVRIRWQPREEDIHSFADIGVVGCGGRAFPVIRGSLFDPKSGLGTFGRFSIAKLDHGVLGMRYSSSWTTFGFEFLPLHEDRQVSGWACLRIGQWFAGIEMKELQRASHCQLRSVGIGYTIRQPQGGGEFQASAELHESKNLVLTVLQHLPIQRRVKNPLEDDKVVGITNYLDFGVEVAAPLVEVDVKDEAKSECDEMFRLACSWQMNKNILMKTRLSTTCVALAAAFKSWWEPNVCISIAAKYEFHERKISHGFEVRIENCGTVKYERAHPSLAGGPARTQRHRADSEEVKMATGYRPYIAGETWTVASSTRGNLL